MLTHSKQHTSREETRRQEGDEGDSLHERTCVERKHETGDKHRPVGPLGSDKLRVFNDSLEVIHWEGSWTALSRAFLSIYSNATSLCQFDADCHSCLSFVEDQKVAAPDVALYGLHVIIPLMSSEVLKVSPSAPQVS